MNVSAGFAIAGRRDAGRAFRDGGIVIGILVLVLFLPPLVYGF